MIEPVTIRYATHPTRKGNRELFADLYPSGAGQPADLLIWMHSGGFRTGSRQHRSHPRIAAEFALHGYASAFIDYRLARPAAVLRGSTEAKLAELMADAETAGEEMHPTFYGPRALAVVEDCCAFLNHAAGALHDYGLSGRMVLGGSSAGAISALNTLYLSRFLGLSRPAVSTVFACSGGFAYPGHLTASGARVLALHAPADARVPVSSIRRLAAASPDPFRLIEHEEHKHGDLCLTSHESLAAAVARFVAFDRADDPMTALLPALRKEADRASL